jgi:hypothetical protein
MKKILENELVKISVDSGRGTLDLLGKDGSLAVRGAGAGVQIAGRWFYSTEAGEGQLALTESVDTEGRPVKRGTLTCAKVSGAPSFQWWFELRADSPLVRLGLTVINDGKKPVVVEAFAPLVLVGEKGGAVYPGSKAKDYHILVNTDGEGIVRLKDLTDPACHEGWWDLGLHNTKTKQGIVFGTISARRFKTKVSAASDPKQKGDSPVASLRLEQEAYERAVAPGERLDSEQICVNFAEPTEVAYRTYAQAAGKEMGAKTLPEIPGGWNAWYIPWYTVDEKYVLQNANFIASRPDIFNSYGTDGFKYVLIDYGWQAGDIPSSGANEWNPDKFPRGMAAVADDIRALGFKPGLWLAPAQISLNTRAFMRHPHIGVRSSNGGHFLVADWLLKYGAMVPDCTLPAGRKYVQEQIREIICDWGYELLVLEETDIAACWKNPLVRQVEPGSPEWVLPKLVEDPEAKAVYHDPEITPVEHYRLLVRTCIDAAQAYGAEVMVMPCGGPNLTNTGLFSVNVCSPDGSWGYYSSDDWEVDYNNPKIQPQNLAYRYYMHDNLWTIDREGFCVSEPRPLSLAIMDVCSAALSGGFAFNGDDLINTTEERLQLIARCLPFYGKAARPIGLFDEKHPSVWDLKVSADFEAWDVVAVFNYSGDLKEEKKTVDFSALGLKPEATYLAFDFWQSEFLGEYKGKLTLSLPGRSMRLLGLREKTGAPQLLATDVHYTMGGKEILRANWSAAQKRLYLVYRCPRQADGKLFVYVPAGWKMKPLSKFSPVTAESVHPRVLALTVPYNDELTSLEIEFEKA